MDWIERFNRVLDYIEDHLTGDIQMKEIAKLAYCSEYHFPRMFSSMTGVTLMEYIRRRRLSVAAFELQNSSNRIIDIALKYGYDSPDAFSRAFKNLHGVNPTAARGKGVQLKAFPRISFQISIKGEEEMEYRIEEIDFELVLVGVSHPVVTQDAFKTIPALWEKAGANGYLQRLIDMSWENPKCKMEGLLGVCGKQAAIMDEEFNYFMGVRYDHPALDDMDTLVIPTNTWVVFPNVMEAWKRLYTEWVPTSGYELADLPCIENYLAPDRNPNSELWVPIVKK
ncbi:AraC family transcriptional regulator [Caldalkalibacillus mannanilyticus]|uniref:AraC family transcriptional regulator n=1 Tax=Caldalkalibacillus mannanilyticus TaxID=1418 RepID=UPI0004683640|nr:GyrI-like domain-containing protein [Caldalkalibacillus mannanilyticus]